MENPRDVPTHVGEILKELGFRPDAPETTGHALVLNLIRATYGAQAAQAAARELLKIRNTTNANIAREFENSSAIPNSSDPIQMSLFDRKSS